MRYPHGSVGAEESCDLLASGEVMFKRQSCSRFALGARGVGWTPARGGGGLTRASCVELQRGKSRYRPWWWLLARPESHGGWTINRAWW
jgi:hypothetical protein